MDCDPVRASLADAVRHQVTVLGEADGRNGGRAIVGKSIGILQTSALGQSMFLDAQTEKS